MPEQAVSAKQRQAICHGEGPMLVLAGPGSGKTFVITRRIRSLIEEKKIPPEQILVLTFTRAAAGEMRQRFHALTEQKGYPVNFGTFHAVYYHILKSAYHYTNNPILTEKEKRELLRTAWLQTAGESRGQLLEEAREEQLLGEISCLKNLGKAPEAYDGLSLEKEVFGQFYARYSALLKERGKLDFDDMASACLRLLQTQPRILQGWQEKFRYILIDEFQDVNPVQYAAIRLIAEPRNNLFAVGDDDQSIYAFRGSDPSIMLGFPTDYPKAEQVVLHQNYRCRPAILQMAGRLIGANRNRFPKEIKAEREADGSRVAIRGFVTRTEQCETLAREMGNIWRKEGEGSVAAIVRTNTDASFLAEALARNKIPFHMKEKAVSIYADPVCQDLLAYLKFAKAGRKRADFFRIMNKPVRYLARAACGQDTVSLEQLRQYYGEKGYMQQNLQRLETDLGRLMRMDLYAAVHYIRHGMGYEEFLKQQAAEQGRSYAELREKADGFAQCVRGFSSLDALCDHIAAYEAQLARKAQEKTEEHGVRILTMHGAKGLEFAHVYLPDCNEGIVPHKKSMQGTEVEEERRMFYVAMTRARERLTLAYVKGDAQNPGFPSRFLWDCGYRET